MQLNKSYSYKWHILRQKKEEGRLKYKLTTAYSGFSQYLKPVFLATTVKNTLFYCMFDLFIRTDFLADIFIIMLPSCFQLQTQPKTLCVFILCSFFFLTDENKKKLKKKETVAYWVV